MMIRLERHPVRWSFPGAFDFERAQLFDRYLGRESTRMSGGFPALDIAESASETIVVAELPGVQKEDIALRVQDGVLTISGERKALELPENGCSLRSEISRGEFRRSIELPHPVKLGDVSAELNSGVLRIRLPKAEEARTREVPVK